MRGAAQAARAASCGAGRRHGSKFEQVGAPSSKRPYAVSVRKTSSRPSTGAVSSKGVSGSCSSGYLGRGALGVGSGVPG